MALDQLLTRIGEFTSYQRRLLALLCLVGFPVVLHEKGPLFWASAGSFHCDTSAMTPPRVSAQGEGFMSSRRPVAVVSEDQCSVRWQVINGTKGGPENNHDDEPCTAWIYEHPRFKSTLVSEVSYKCLTYGCNVHTMDEIGACLRVRSMIYSDISHKKSRVSCQKGPICHA